MLTRKRKSEQMFNTFYPSSLSTPLTPSSSNESEIANSINEIKNLLSEKNIFMKEEIIPENKDVLIQLIDENDNNLIGKISGGVAEFTIIENGEEMDKDAVTISWLKVENKYQGHSLGTFLNIYFLYFCKNNFNNIEYAVLDDDTDELDPSKNIYQKLGFVYQRTREMKIEDGRTFIVGDGPEMQLKITDFFNNPSLIQKLNKIKIDIKNWNRNANTNANTNVKGGKSMKSRKLKKRKRKGKTLKKKTLKKKSFKNVI